MGTTSAITKPEVRELESGLDKLRIEVRAVKVINTPEEYSKAGQLLITIRNYQKDVKNKLNPFVDIAKRAYDSARQEMNRYLNGAEELDGILARPMQDFKRREREAAEASGLACIRAAALSVRVLAVGFFEFDEVLVG